MTRPIPRPDAGQPLPVMLRLLDVVAMTQISESTLMTAVMAGEFPAPKRIGRSLRWSRAAVLRWIDAGDGTG